MLDFETEDFVDATILANPVLVKLETDLVAFLFLAFQPATLLAVLGLTAAFFSVSSL